MKIALGLICAGIAINAAAATNDSGAYVGIGVGYAAVQNYDNGQFGAIIDGGYAFNEYLALEGDLALISNETQSAGGYSAVANTSFLMAAIRGTLPLNELFSLYGKAGIGFNFANVSFSGYGYSSSANTSTNVAGLLAIGGAFNLSRHFVLKVENDYFITKNGGDACFNGSYCSSNFGYGNTNIINGAVEYRF